MTALERKLRYSVVRRFLGKMRVEVLLPGSIVRRVEDQAQRTGRSRMAELADVIENAVLRSSK